MVVKNTAVVARLVVVAVSVVVAGMAASARVAAQPSFPEAVAYSIAHPDAVPPGVNDFSCVPTDAHPEPVVLVHGFLENAYDNWAFLGPELVDDGHCVYALNYGAPEGFPFGGLGSTADSASELAGFVDDVLAATGASEVAIVGHSKGGVVPRYYVRFLGGAERVSKIVALSPPNYPTPGPPADDTLETLNTPSDTVPGVEYTVIATRYDQVVPYTASLLTGEGSRNVVLQDLCPGDTVEHTGISYDPVARQIVSNALNSRDPVAVEC